MKKGRMLEADASFSEQAIKEYKAQLFAKESNRPAITQEYRRQTVDQQLDDLNDVMSEQMHEQYYDLVNKRHPGPVIGKEQSNWPREISLSDVPTALAREKNAVEIAREKELADKKAIFEQAVANGQIRADAIERLYQETDGSVRIVTFSGDNFSATRWQVSGFLARETGDNDLFRRLLRGEKITHEAVDTQNPHAVDTRVKNLYREARTKETIAKYGQHIDLSKIDPNDTSLPQELRQDAQTPEFQAIVRSRNLDELAQALQGDNPELQQFLQTPDFQSGIDFANMLTKSAQEQQRWLVDKSPEIMAIIQKSSSLEQLGRQYEKRMADLISNNAELRQLRGMSREQLMNMAINQSEELTQMTQHVGEQIQQLMEEAVNQARPLLEDIEQMQDQLRQVGVPGKDEFQQLVELTRDAFLQRSQKWGLFDNYAPGRRDKHGSDIALNSWQRR